MEGWFAMAVTVKEDYRTALEEQKLEVREMVLAGLNAGDYIAFVLLSLSAAEACR